MLSSLTLSILCSVTPATRTDVPVTHLKAHYDPHTTRTSIVGLLGWRRSLVLVDGFGSHLGDAHFRLDLLLGLQCAVASVRMRAAHHHQTSSRPALGPRCLPFAGPSRRCRSRSSSKSGSAPSGQREDTVPHRFPSLKPRQQKQKPQEPALPSSSFLFEEETELSVALRYFDIPMQPPLSR